MAQPCDWGRTQPLRTGSNRNNSNSSSNNGNNSSSSSSNSSSRRSGNVRSKNDTYNIVDFHYPHSHPRSRHHHHPRHSDVRHGIRSRNGPRAALFVRSSSSSSSSPWVSSSSSSPSLPSSRSPPTSFTAALTTIVVVLVATLCTTPVAECRYSDEAEFTLSVPAGRNECFFQTARKDQVLEVEYQVLDAGSSMAGDASMSIDFTLTAPDGVVMVHELDKAEAVHRLELRLDGDYRMCLGNTRSMLSSKLVYFEVFVDNGAGSDSSSREGGAGAGAAGNNNDDDDPFDLGSVTLAPERHLNATEVDKMKARLGRLYNLLNQIERYQEWQKAHESRHRNLVEHNFTKVNCLSFLLAAVMLVVGGIQIVAIRGFFEDKYAMYRLIKGG